MGNIGPVCDYNILYSFFFEGVKGKHGGRRRQLLFLSLQPICLSLEDSVVGVVAPHDPAGGGLLDAQDARCVRGRQSFLVNQADQLYSHLDGGRGT